MTNPASIPPPERINDPRPTAPRPALDTLLERALMDGENDTTDGCSVPECDGVCPHGYPTWVRYLGLA